MHDVRKARLFRLAVKNGGPEGLTLEGAISCALTLGMDREQTLALIASFEAIEKMRRETRNGVDYLVEVHVAGATT